MKNFLVCVENLYLLGNNDDTSVLLCLHIWLGTITQLLPVIGCKGGKAGCVFRHFKEVVGQLCTD